MALARWLGSPGLERWREAPADATRSGDGSEGAGAPRARRCGGRCGWGPATAPERLALSLLGARTGPPEAAAMMGRSSPLLRAGGRSERGAGERRRAGPSYRRRRALLGRGPCGPPGASPGKVVSRLPRALHPRAGGPRRASPGPLLLLASLSLAAWRAGRGGGGGRGGGRALLAAVSSACRGSGGQKSLCVPGIECPGSRSHWHTPQGRGESEAAVAVAAASPRPAVAQSAERARGGVLRFAFSSFPLPVLFSRGVKKPHNLRMCARVEIDVGRKKKKEGGSVVRAVREETVRASLLGLPGGGGGGGFCRSVLPDPPPTPSSLRSFSFCLGEEGRGDSFLLPPHPRPVMPGQATFATSKLSHHVSAQDPRPMGRWINGTDAPGVGSGRFWTPLIQGLCRPCPCPKLSPFTTRTGDPHSPHAPQTLQEAILRCPAWGWGGGKL